MEYKEYFLLKIYITYLFILERGREGEREGEKHPFVVASSISATGDLARNLGMCSDQESNQQPFSSQAHTQPTELHQPGIKNTFKINTKN